MGQEHGTTGCMQISDSVLLALAQSAGLSEDLQLLWLAELPHQQLREQSIVSCFNS